MIEYLETFYKQHVLVLFQFFETRSDTRHSGIIDGLRRFSITAVHLFLLACILAELPRRWESNIKVREQPVCACVLLYLSEKTRMIDETDGFT